MTIVLGTIACTIVAAEYTIVETGIPATFDDLTITVRDTLGFQSHAGITVLKTCAPFRSSDGKA